MNIIHVQESMTTGQSVILASTPLPGSRLVAIPMGGFFDTREFNVDDLDRAIYRGWIASAFGLVRLIDRAQERAYTLPRIKPDPHGHRRLDTGYNIHLCFSGTQTIVLELRERR